MTAPQRYRRKTMEVEAVQLTREADWDAIAAWCGGIVEGYEDGYREMAIPREGRSHLAAYMESWIVKRDGDFTVCGGARFRHEFEPVLAKATVRIPPKLPIGVTPPVTVNDKDELARIIYLTLTGLIDWVNTPFTNEVAANRQTNVIVDALLSGKTAAQLAHEATNGQEGGEA